MLNNTGIKKETYGSGKQILFAVEHQVSMGIVVDKSVGVAEGTKKIAKAGTPLTGDLDARGTAFTAATTSTDSNHEISSHQANYTDYYDSTYQFATDVVEQPGQR